MPLLRSPDWNVRIHGALAFETILGSYRVWTPPAASSYDVEALLSFDDIDLSRIISQGEPLLSSAGTEYDVNWNDMGRKERLALQRRLLRKRLGIIEGVSADNTKEMIKDEDLLAIDTTGMSAREKHAMKRKAKLALKSKKNSSTFKTPVKRQRVREDLIVDEQGEWPLEPFAEFLKNDLLHPEWHIRHGACLGLRMLLKKHWRSAGGCNNDAWMTDVLLRILLLLALDRFTDFVSDKAIAPVRESCGQFLGTLAEEYLVDKPELLVKLGGYLKVLAESFDDAWQVRHGGLIGLKYILRAHSKPLGVEFEAIFPILLRSLKDADDDVKGVSAEILTAVLRTDNIDRIVGKEDYSSLFAILWDDVQRADDLSPATARILDLLAHLYQMPSSMQDATVKFDREIELLFPFFRHSLLTVRNSVLKILFVFLRGAFTPNPLLYRLLFQNVLFEQDPSLREASFSAFSSISLHFTAKDVLPELYSAAMTFVHAEISLDTLCTASGESALRIEVREIADVNVVAEETVLQGRLLGVEAITCIAHETNYQVHFSILKGYLTSDSSYQRCLAMLALSFMLRKESLRKFLQTEFYDVLTELFDEILSSRIIFTEFSNEYAMVKANCESLSSSTGIPFNGDAFEDFIQAVNDAELTGTLQILFNNYQELATTNVTRYQAMLASLLSSLGKVDGGIVRCLMGSIKSEPFASYQSVAAHSLIAILASSSLSDTVKDKVLKNILLLLCSDRSVCLLLSEHPGEEMIIEPPMASALPVVRGAQSVLGGVYLAFFKDVWKWITSPFVEKSDIQGMMEGLHVASVLSQYIPEDSYDMFIVPFLPLLIDALFHKKAALRFMAASCYISIMKQFTMPLLEVLIDSILPIFDSVDIYGRLGAVELIKRLVDDFGDGVLPFVIFLVVPILTRMNDSVEAVRVAAAKAFADLIKLVPVDAQIPGAHLSERLIRKREEQKGFLAQIMDVKKVEPFTLPVSINATLRPYQQEGLNWLAFLNRFNLHGILCDDMGLGKTLQTICMLVSDTEVRRNGLPSLIVCPTSVAGHWRKEFSVYADRASLLYMGPPGKRKELRHLVKSSEFVITSYDILRNDRAFLTSLHWNYCVLDEGHIIKGARTKITLAAKAIKAEHRLILSGTPIQNNIEELWSLFDFLMPGYLGSEREFQVRYGRKVRGSKQDARNLALEALHKQVLPFLLRRMKEDVLDDLPPKIIQDYQCYLTDVQRELYRKINLEERKKPVHIFSVLQYLRRLCNHPILATKPDHPLYASLVSSIGKKDSYKQSAKLVSLRQLLLDCGIGGASEGELLSQHRVLIFSQMKGMLDIIERDLFKPQMPNLSYLRLDGSVEASSRFDIVERFNSDPSIDVLLLTTTVGGLGLNLTGADTVIFVDHDWNPMVDLQAMDRAHRLGQRKVVNVYRLITRGTLEEKIMSVQRFKMAIAGAIVNQQNSSLASMNTDELLTLLTVDDGDESSSPSGATESDRKEQRLIQKHAGISIDGDVAEWKDHEDDLDLDLFLSK